MGHGASEGPRLGVGGGMRGATVLAEHASVRWKDVGVGGSRRGGETRAAAVLAEEASVRWKDAGGVDSRRDCRASALIEESRYEFGGRFNSKFSYM